MSVEESESTIAKEKTKKHKKEKKSHRDDLLGQQPSSEDHNAEVKAKRKREKHEKEHPSGDARLDAASETTNANAVETIKKKKKRKHSEGNDDSVGEPSPKKKQRKSVDAVEDGGDRGNQTTTNNGEIKEKSRKKKGKRTGDDDATEKAKIKKKREPKRDDVLNPAEDSSLGEQALKALSYAYTQFADPTSWKFNKAKQNWLIRNVWSDQAIPDVHFPLLLRYLARVKGGVRDALQRSCQEILQPPAELPKDASPKKRVTFATGADDTQSTQQQQPQEEKDNSIDTKVSAKSTAKEAHDLALRTSRASQVLQCLAITAPA